MGRSRCLDRWRDIFVDTEEEDAMPFLWCSVVGGIDLGDDDTVCALGLVFPKPLQMASALLVATLC